MTGGNKNPKESLKDVVARYNDQLAKKAKRPAGLDLPTKNQAKRGRVGCGGGGVGGGRGGGGGGERGGRGGGEEAARGGG